MKHLLSTAIALLMMQTAAIAQETANRLRGGLVSRSVLQFVLRASGGLEEDGTLKTPISTDDVYGFCPDNGSWLHALEFDPTTYVIFVVDDCELVAIDFELPSSGGL